PKSSPGSDGHSVILGVGSQSVLYSGGKVTDLGSLGTPYTWVAGINGSGQVVGQSQTASGAYHAFLYSGGQMTDLGTLPGTKSGFANGINDAGQVVGESNKTYAGPSQGRGEPNTHAFLFINGKLTDLNSLIPADSGWVLWSANAINNRGQIV